jgi:hypothetical protein
MYVESFSINFDECTVIFKTPGMLPFEQKAKPELPRPRINALRFTMSDPTPIRAVILVGGPTRGTRFRPLSLNSPKPLFLLAGRPLIWHHIAACRRELPGLREVLLLGSYNAAEFSKFIEETQQELDVKIEYVSCSAFFGIQRRFWSGTIFYDMNYFNSYIHSHLPKGI